MEEIGVKVTRHERHLGEIEAIICRNDRANVGSRDGGTSGVYQECDRRKQHRKQSKRLREEDDQKRLWRV